MFIFVYYVYIMKAVILAGGLGTRLRPITYETPKPLITVKKKPILNHLIELFGRHGVDSISILINKQHEVDFSRWQKAWAEELSRADVTIIPEEEPRGTFGGLQLLKEWLNDEPFFLSNGDELKDFDLQALRDFHKKEKSLGTIALVEVANPSEYGVPILHGNKIKQFLEKPQNPPSNFISSGLYFLEPKVFSYADNSKEYLMIEKDIFPKIAEAGLLSGMKMEKSRWYDCGTLERWEKAIKEW